MQLHGVIWKDKFANKIYAKHNVTTDEVEQVLFSSKYHVRGQKKGRVKGEDIYLAHGQTESGRFLIVVFIYKSGNLVLPISARSMSRSERGYYEKR